jgi:hypothetical protein
MALLRRSRADLVVATVIAAWIAIVLVADGSTTLGQQRLLGLATWGLLLLLLRRERGMVRAQVAVVVVFATCIEYVAAPLLGVYTYRLGNVPSFVPPGHGMVYLCALALGRSTLFTAFRRPIVLGVLTLGGMWALYGVTLAGRSDVLGAIFFACLVGFMLVGRAPLVYAGAFLVTTYLELIGTHVGTWTWSERDPLTGLFTIGNPPSGIPGGYCFFDAAALVAAPLLLVRLEPLWLRLLQWRHRQAVVPQLPVVELRPLAVPAPDHRPARGVDPVREAHPLLVPDTG